MEQARRSRASAGAVSHWESMAAAHRRPEALAAAALAAELTVQRALAAALASEAETDAQAEAERPGTPTLDELVASLAANPGAPRGFAGDTSNNNDDGGPDDNAASDDDEGCGRSTTPELGELLEADLLAEAHLGADGRPKPLPPLPPAARAEGAAEGALPALRRPQEEEDEERAQRGGGRGKQTWMRLEDALLNVLRHMREVTQQSAAAVGAAAIGEDAGEAAEGGVGEGGGRERGG